jgi:hypothetical protein
MAVLIVCLFGTVRGFGAAVGSASVLPSTSSTHVSAVGAVGLAGSVAVHGLVAHGRWFGSSRASVSDGLGDSGSVAGNFSAFALSLGAANRTSAWLWVLDMWCLSVICLEVNHAESLYWVLVSAFVGTFVFSLGGSARALFHSLSALGCQSMFSLQASYVTFLLVLVCMCPLLV